MARTFKTGYKITGDAKGAITATRATRKEIEKLNRAQRRGNSFAKQYAGNISRSKVAMAGFGLAVALGARKMGQFITRIASDGDKVQKLGISLGVSTEFISGMGHAAELSGGSLDGFATSVKKMQKSIGDLDAGLSTQVRSFARLGLAYKDIKNLNPEDQFLTIAERLGQMDNAALRTATAMDIFGRQGATMIPLFVQGAEGIQGMRDEAERLGLVMTQDFADASAQFNDDLTRTKGVFTGISRQIGEGLLPEMTALMQSFVDNAGASDTWATAGEFVGKVVRTMVGAFVVLKDTVVIVGKILFQFSQLVFNSFAAVLAPVTGFVDVMGRAITAIKNGDFKGAAAALGSFTDTVKAKYSAAMTGVRDSVNEMIKIGADGFTETFDKVNDIMSRTAVVSQGAAKGAGAAGDEIGKLGSTADAAAVKLQNLLDRLDPLAAIDRRFSVDAAVLAGKIAEGGDEVERYTELLRLLTVEYGENIKALNDAGKQTQKTTRSMGKQFDTFAETVRRGVERMDDLFANMWRGLLSGGKSVMSTLKSFFKNWLAEMAHAAFTRPIVVSMTAAMGSFGSTVAAAAGQAVTGGGVSGGGGVPGVSAGGFGGFLSGIGALFTGNSIGSGFANLPAFLGGNTVGELGPQAGFFSGAPGVSNLAFGAAGLLGGIGGQAIFGGQGGIGGSIGAMIGMATPLGPLGALIGGIIGGALGGLFGKKKKPRISAGGGLGGNLRAGNSEFAESSLGGFYIGNTRGKGIDEFKSAAIDAIKNFDSVIASVLGEEGLAKATGALEGWAITLKKDAVTIENLLNSRWRVIMGTLPDDIREYVSEFSGIQEQVSRLGLASGAQRIIDAVPDLFQGRTFREFISVAEAMQVAGEDLTETFNRLVKQMAAIATATSIIKAIGESNIADDFDRLMRTQSRTLSDVVAGYREQLAGLADSFDGSADSVGRLATLSSALYESEIAFMLQIEQVRQGIVGGFGNLREQIERDLFGDQVFFDRIKSRAEDLAASLQTMTDPAQIAATVAEIQRLTGSAYSLLDAGQKQAMGADFLAFMGGVTADALARVGLAENSFIGLSEKDHALIAALGDGLGDPLEIAASAQLAAAEALTQAAADLSASVLQPGNAPPPGDPGAPSLPGLDPDIIAAAIGEAIAGASAETVAAIRAALADLQINIQVPAGTLING